MRTRAGQAALKRRRRKGRTRLAVCVGVPQKRRRLSRSAEFDRVYRQGRSRGNRWLVLHAFPRGADDGARLGLSVGRKVGGAVARNRAKRLLREALRLEGRHIPDGLDLVVVARPSVAGASYVEVAGDLRSVLAAAGLDGGDER